MKNLIKLILCIFILGLGANSNAQTTLGIRAGFNYAGVAFVDGVLRISPNRIFGLAGGILVDYKLNKIVSIQPEINFIQKGFKSSEFGIERTVKFNYLEIPIHSKYTFEGGKKIQWVILLGTTIGFAINGEEKECTNGNCQTINLQLNNESGFRRTDIGISLGGGINISRFFVDFRVGLGLSNISRISGPTKIKTKGIQCGLGYFFNKN